MKNPNGYGTIKKLSGKRRRPFAVMITTEYEKGMTADLKEIEFLKGRISDELYTELEKEYSAFCETAEIKYTQKQKAIGYYATRKEAMVALAEYNRNPYSLDKKSLTFDDIYTGRIKNEKLPVLSEGTQKNYETAYKACTELHDMRITDIKADTLQKFFSLSESSVYVQRNILTLLRWAFEYAMESDIVEKDYSRFVKLKFPEKKNEKEPFTRDEIYAIKEYVSDTENRAVRHADTVLFMIYTGLRVGEMLSLKSEDVHLDERYITVRGTKTKAAQRLVPIHRDIHELVARRMNENKTYLFTMKKDSTLQYNRYIRAVLIPLLEELNIEGKTSHTCRHTFASLAASCGMNEILKKKIIGHKSADITIDTYTHVFIEDIVREIDKLKI